jgi:hypothetical protein
MVSFRRLPSPRDLVAHNKEVLPGPKIDARLILVNTIHCIERSGRYVDSRESELK